MGEPPFVNDASVEGLLGCFHVWTLTNEAAVNICVFLCEHQCSCLWDKYLGVELPGCMISVCFTLLCFTRNGQIVSLSGGTVPHSHQQ